MNGTAVEQCLNGLFDLLTYAVGVITYDLDWMQVPLIYWIIGFIFMGFMVDYLLR